ncbi:hypothetical protein THH46_14820 [Pseudomonas sp. NA13]
MGLAYGAIAQRVLDNLIGSVYMRHGIVGADGSRALAQGTGGPW